MVLGSPLDEATLVTQNCLEEESASTAFQQSRYPWQSSGSDDRYDYETGRHRFSSFVYPK